MTRLVHRKLASRKQLRGHDDTEQHLGAENNRGSLCSEHDILRVIPPTVMKEEVSERLNRELVDRVVCSTLHGSALNDVQVSFGPDLACTDVADSTPY